MPFSTALRIRTLRLFAAAAFFLGAGCATPQQESQTGLMPAGDYEALIDGASKNVKLYDGFMNVLNVTGTLLGTRVARAQIDQNARIYQWTPEQIAAEKTKVEDSQQKETQVFVSFFVPERRHDDLHKSTTRWKIFLDAAGRRFEGKAARQRSLLVELQTLYPYHTRWGTPYLITFPVPAKLVEKGEAKVTFTGPVGSASLTFPPAE